MSTTLYRALGRDLNHNWIVGTVAVPDHLPHHAPENQVDVSVYIKQELELDFLEDYKLLEAAE